MDNIALSFSTTTNVKFTHEQLVSFFSAAELNRGETFEVYVKYEYRELKYKGPGDRYEDHLVNALVNGGSLCVVDLNDSYKYGIDIDDPDSPETLEGVNKYKNSLVLDVVSLEQYDFGFYNEPWYAPVYEITLDRISKAFQEILSGNTTSEDKDDEKCLIENYQNTFVNKSGDYFDAWNIFQYIVFGDIIYG